MTTYLARLDEVKNCFLHKDYHLGFRKLLDVAMDTQDMDVYKRCIVLTHWKEEHPKAEEQLSEKCLEEVERLKSFTVPEANTSIPIIDARELVKVYPNSRFKLGPVSVAIKKGNVYGLVGENGNGKTTLLRILGKELSFQSGQIQYHFNKAPNNQFEERSKLVYIPQRTQTWYGPLKDNLKFVLSSYGVPKDEIEPRMFMMIARLGLWQYQNLKWSELSSGYKMRFELARTLLRQPEVMLLDEPLANLDVLAQQTVIEDLISICNSISNPIALILSSQQLYEVEKVSDKIIFLKNGQYRENLNESGESDAQGLVIEIESSNKREELLEAFAHLALEKLVFNGGVYLAYFKDTTQLSDVLTAAGTFKLNIVYLRDISKSTRRFFVS